MGHVVLTTHVEATPEQVFDFAAKPERIPEWHASLIEVKSVSGPLDAVGASYTGVMKVAGRRLDGRWVVTEVERPSQMTQRGTAPGGGSMTLIMRCAAAAGATDVTVELDCELPGGFVGGLADHLFIERAIERDLKHTMENFKAIAEAEVPTPV